MEKPIEHQLLRLHVLLGDDEHQLDEVYQAFQEIDRSGKGQLKNVAYVAYGFICDGHSLCS